jgi:NAD(P)H-dependent flavin oxidoreductase YrpB (nitropropane dioxygenase family)
MKLPELKIDKLVAKIPIIQGGMAVRISTAPLAAAVANEGGIGIIAATGMSVKELVSEIRHARNLTDGIIGINIMFAFAEFANIVKAALNEGIDLIISGAGFSRDIFQWGENAGVPIVPIVSTANFAKLAEKLGAAALIVEGKEAGGHLGTDRPMSEIVPEVKEVVNIPVIAAGGIIDGADIVNAFRLGADGVQMGTRFAASEESGASQEFKDLYLKSGPEQVVLINSPVGLPGRALINEFSQKIISDLVPGPRQCIACLKKCSKRFCILAALNNAQIGNLLEGLVFSGENVGKIKDILPVKEIIHRLKAEVEAIPL